ncbi:helix-turn-helix domain-containing protein [Microbacterium sp. 5K110]|jgi:AraC-like DNA-binding protein|uniref:helix-turn-helix transcriptional regulator n=1 Tax=unclassified Microbacterium TaxID=2609290 RepID=UPI0010FD8AE3|nr:helix-turn-helix domain-containing protein [Microbacterium sp. 5K110]TLF29164.1 helix-turn-helix domain-containing protein [Microbacterium sp. 5K110]
MARSLRVEGSAVIDWFAERSLAAAPDPRVPTILIADEAEVAALTIRRVWHTGATIQPLDESGPGSILVLQAEGSTTLRMTDTNAELEAGDALLYPHAALSSATTSHPTARIEILSVHSLLGHPAPLPGADDSPAWRALASTVNAILNGDHRLGVAAESALGHAIESLCAALIAGRPGADADASGFRSAQATFAAATRVLTERAADPDFTVEELARTLDVSRQYLARVFARHGSTPRSALRARRLELADALAATGLSSTEIARRSGFPSARALSHARRDRDTRDGR